MPRTKRATNRCSQELVTPCQIHVKKENKAVMRDAPGREHFIVFIEDLNLRYNFETAIGQSVVTTATSPFIGKTKGECFDLLVQMVRNGADINYEDMIIMDKRSLRDDSVLLVEQELLIDPKDAADDSGVPDCSEKYDGLGGWEE